MNAKTQYIEGLRQLAADIKSIEFYHTAFVYAGRHAMNEGCSFFEAKDHPDVKAWRQFKEDIVGELNAAIKAGQQDYEFDLAFCRKLSIELSQGFYKDGSPLIFESITEVTALADRLEHGAKIKGSKDTSIAEADDTPHPYKIYFAEYCQANPSVSYPKAAAAKAYWRIKLDKNERKEFADEESFVRSFKRYLGK